MASGGFSQSIISSFITSDSPKHIERSKTLGHASHSGSAEQMSSHTHTHASTQDRADVLLADVKEQFVGITKQNCMMIKSVIINPFWKQESQIDHQGLRRNVRLPHISPFHVHMCDGGRNLLDAGSLCGCVQAFINKTCNYLPNICAPVWKHKSTQYLKGACLILWYVCSVLFDKSAFGIYFLLRPRREFIWCSLTHQAWNRLTNNNSHFIVIFTM